jgi:hypothetical protein
MNIIEILQSRFQNNPHRHQGINWEDVEARLTKYPTKLTILEKMEETGGEPDVIGYDEAMGEYIWVDCSPESPSGRRSLCYDDTALNARKENKPKWSAVEEAKSMGLKLLDEAEYRHLQTLGAFDQKTSSWIETPEHIRKLGGAIFCDRRYDTVWLYHNSAESYYAARGWRGMVRI